VDPPPKPVVLVAPPIEKPREPEPASGETVQRLLFAESEVEKLRLRLAQASKAQYDSE